MIFCDTDIVDYSPRNCGIDFAGVVGLGIINDYENPTLEQLADPDFWTEKLAATPLKYWAITNTRGQYQDAELVEEEDLIGTLVTAVNHIAMIDVPEIRENRNFWEAIKVKNWKICLVTSGGLMYYIDKPVTFIPRIINPRGVKQASYFQVDMKWVDISNPYILEAPEGIFTGSLIEIPESSGVFDYTFDYTFQ